MREIIWNIWKIKNSAGKEEKKFMYYYSKNSKEKVFHRGNCRYAASRKEKGWSSFENIHEAHRAGYRECRCCCPMGYQYYKEQETIEDLRQKEDIFFQPEKDIMWVDTRQSKWCLVISGRGNSLAMYHKNTAAGVKQQPDSPIEGYHSQRVSFSSIEACADYILNHDRYNLIHPSSSPKKKAKKKNPKKGTRKWKLQQERKKREEREEAIKRVEYLISCLEKELTA